MVSTKPNISPADRFSVTQTARLLGVTINTLNAWERNGSIEFWHRKANGRRFTTGKQIIKCWAETYL